MPNPPANPIGIFYVNGGNQAVQMYVFDTGSNEPVLWDGVVNVGPPTAPSTFGNGQGTVASPGTAQALAGSTTIKGVTVKALKTNSGTIYIGDASVDSSNGYPLEAGAQLAIAINNLNKVFVDASGASQSYAFAWVN